MVTHANNSGIWWWTKMINRVVGEERYDAVRVWRRTISNKFYYYRQQLLYQCFVETPDIACMLGIYPKVDSSHGFGYFSIAILIQTPMKCTEISRKIPSTVTDLLVCGSPTWLLFIWLMNAITISCHGIGIKPQHAKMVNKPESE